ncbi:ParA family protein [Salinicola sp. V024]|uniref:ParA family protein n=1 Tax=Salinicola TaxID=404432 RepID=UPI00094E68CD|nr:ParA family protein [Salinicola sp. MH3R3-1]OLO08173.1 chromosome partitioning protein ParA [Salinicola sp. MH3R3-1]
MKVVALHNLKGGVGKSSAAVNLAREANRDGLPVLLWDLDAQGASTWILGGENGMSRKVGKLLSGKSPLGEQVQHTPWERFDLLPADMRLRELDRILEDKAEGDKHLKRLIEPFSEEYALMILDCPPGLSTLAEQLIRAADRILVPTIPSPLSVQAFSRMLTHLDLKKRQRERVLPFFNLVDRRRRLHCDWIDSPPEALGRTLENWIPYASDIERMSLENRPLADLAPRSRATHAYRRLWQELKTELGE